MEIKAVGNLKYAKKEQNVIGPAVNDLSMTRCSGNLLLYIMYGKNKLHEAIWSFTTCTRR